MSTQTLRRLRRTKDTEIVADPHGDLEAEVMVLREDNARLQAAQHRPADIGALVATVRALPVHVATAAEDEAAQVLVDGLLLRDALLDACEELSRSMEVVQDRLRELGTATPLAAMAHGRGIQEARRGARRR